MYIEARFSSEIRSNVGEKSDFSLLSGFLFGVVTAKKAGMKKVNLQAGY